MKRSPLRRVTRLRPRRPTPRKSERKLDPAYLDLVRALPCYVCGRRGPSEADHQGARPYGRKADDRTAVPMCRTCHARRTDGWLPRPMGSFEVDGNTWTGRLWERADKARMRAWCDEAILRTQLTLSIKGFV